ncbi:unnamed protein product [Bursaphelenchus xylophilus]|uniref:Galectin n=1 Tax=Bursaphelenchus xylophilus TaxID=6326 RepID=A0A1I7RSG1_BURXY|nr:unnamed protein product [Bursaphelenchus xylophilus]CAG9122975.1 unnamed protein product [Bursaphelenchus xylophilus]
MAEGTVQSISRPEVPFAAVIPGGVFPGRAVLVRGHVNDSSSRFNIDFCCGHVAYGDHRDDKALHFDARFDPQSAWPFKKPDRDIVLNSLINNVWGLEHRVSNPLTVNEHFTLRILVLRDYYKFTLNGKFLCDFVHRIPVDRIVLLYIAGCLRIDEIQYQGALQINDLDSPQLNRTGEPVSVSKPEIPFVHILDGFAPPKRIKITGTPKMNSDRFEFDLMNDKEEYVFHFRVDLPSNRAPRGAVVRNSTKRDEWQEEERDIPSFPFKFGHTFDLILIARMDSVEVVVDGLPFCTFHYRFPQTGGSIKSFKIYGDIVVQNVEFQ